MKKYIALIALSACLPAASRASFELLLALDYFGHQVLRYDGETGIAFGKFGRDRLINPGAMSLDQPSSRVTVYDLALNSFQVFNYNTGELLQEIPGPGYTAALMAPITGGGFLMGDYNSNTVRRYSANGTVLATFQAPAGAGPVRAMGQAPDGSVYIIHRETYEISRYSPNGGNRLNVVTGFVPEIADCRQMVFQGDSVVLSMGNTYGLNQKEGWLRFSYNTTNWGTPAVTISNILEQSLGLGAGHNEQVYLGGWDSSGNGFIEGYHRTSRLLRQTIALPSGSRPVSLAVVLAPEPSGLAFGCMGIGLALCRRKRK